MVSLILGNKGSGKTKRLINLVNEAVERSNGNVVCVEKERLLIYDINYRARLVETDHYKVSGYDAFFLDSHHALITQGVEYLFSRACMSFWSWSSFA